MTPAIEAISDRILELLKQAPEDRREEEIELIAELVVEFRLAPLPDGDLTPCQLVDLMFQDNPWWSLQDGMRESFADLENQARDPKNLLESLPNLESVRERLFSNR